MIQNTHTHTHCAWPFSVPCPHFRFCGLCPSPPALLRASPQRTSHGRTPSCSPSSYHSPSPTHPRPDTQRPLAHLTRGSELAGSDLALFTSRGALQGTGGNLARGTGEGWTGDFQGFLGTELRSCRFCYDARSPTLLGYQLLWNATFWYGSQDTSRDHIVLTPAEGLSSRG